MEGIFITVLNLSIKVSYIVAAVLVLRLILKKAPAWVHCLMWAAAGLRAVLPITIESPVSLIPSAETIPADIAMQMTPEITTEIPALNQTVNPIIQGSFTPDPATSANPIQIVNFILANIWVLGIAAMLIWALVSYIRLRIKVAPSIKYASNVYLCDAIDTPFLLGFFRPRIYLPSGVREDDIAHIVAHEKAHIKRGDHITKPIGFLILALHWFNPLAWLAYSLFCRDIERAADEKVIAALETDEIKQYSEVLLSCATHERIAVSCPLAFAEVGIKSRIRSILSYKKPTVWIIAAALIVCAALAVFFLTDPITFTPKNYPPLEDVREGYSMEEAIADGCVVIDEREVKGGKDIWNRFVSDTAKGKKASVRIYRHYTESTLDGKSIYFVYDLTYNGEEYNLKYYDSASTGEVIFKDENYKYLTRSKLILNNKLSEHYILSDNEHMTIKEVYRMLLSSYMPPNSNGYHYHTTYDEHLTVSSLTNAEISALLEDAGLTLPKGRTLSAVKKLLVYFEADSKAELPEGWEKDAEFAERVRKLYACITYD